MDGMSRLRFLVVAATVVAVALAGSSGARAASGISPIPCSSAEVIPADPKFDALSGAKAFYGTYQGGFYRFEVPDNWNGELALYMHGTNFSNTLAFSGPGNGLRAYWV